MKKIILSGLFLLLAVPNLALAATATSTSGNASAQASDGTTTTTSQSEPGKTDADSSGNAWAQASSDSESTSSGPDRTGERYIVRTEYSYMDICGKPTLITTHYWSDGIASTDQSLPYCGSTLDPTPQPRIIPSVGTSPSRSPKDTNRNFASNQGISPQNNIAQGTSPINQPVNETNFDDSALNEDTFETTEPIVDEAKPEEDKSLLERVKESKTIRAGLILLGLAVLALIAYALYNLIAKRRGESKPLKF